MSERRPEPWLRGTWLDVPAAQRGVIHALELAEEDLQRWCGSLSDDQINSRPGGLAPVAFHLRHIARSLDRLLTYAEGRALSPDQSAALKSEMDSGATRDAIFSELNSSLAESVSRVRAFDVESSRRGAECRQAAIANQRGRVAGARRRSYAASCGAGHYNRENCAGAETRRVTPSGKS